ncbi:MAG: dihydroorotate dehydrogenase electron transfer subunit [Bacillota bacterium]
MVQILKLKILENKKILPDFYYMVLSAPRMAQEAAPGQFVMLNTSDTLDPFLKRPISINRIDQEKGTISLIYQVVGKGTSLLTKKSAGEEIQVIGPLGKGFTWTQQDKTVALVGGGCGIAPLVALAEELVKNGKQVFVLLGSQCKDKLLSEDEFKELGTTVMVATDDGSYGRRGFVTELLEELIQKKRIDQVYCCGPLPMTKAVVKITKKSFIPCQISLEERMGCGIGACIGCVTKVRRQDGTIDYKKVCHDGPVFTSCEVVFDD